MTTNQPDLQASRRPCKIITMQEKLAILNQLEAGTSRRQVEVMFKCSQSTICRVLAGKDGIIQEAKNSASNKRDCLINFYKKLDKSLSQWAWNMKMTNNIITCGLAKQKAEELSLAIGNGLKPTIGWLYRWKEREHIKFGKRAKSTADEILKGFLYKKGEKAQTERKCEANGMKFKLDNEVNKTVSPVIKQIKERTESHSLTGNSDDSDYKPRIKRDYIKRLPIIDASGAICRNRKEKTFLTLLQKLEILQRLKNGERRPDLSAEYNLSQSAMSQIIADEEKILKLVAGGQNLQMKRIRGGIFKGGEAELNAWVHQKMDNGESLTRAQIKNRAKEIASHLNIDFKASTGWLEKWKTRMNLDFNESQILQRKVPNYMAIDENFEDSHAEFKPWNYFLDQQDDLLRGQIKEEKIEDNYCSDVENDEFIRCRKDEVDVKPEILTTQQVYLQAVSSDIQTPKSTRKGSLKKKIEDELEIKPFMNTISHIGHSKQTTNQLETLHDQVLNWLNRYNIAPVATSELLNILQPHLSAVQKKHV